jgi:hypothetical protein
MEKQSLSHDVPPTNKQDVTRQSQELISKYGGQYLSKKFIYYKSGTRMTVKQNFRYAKMVLTHHHIRDFKDFKEKTIIICFIPRSCNQHNINISIDNFKLHTLLPDSKVNNMVRTMLFNSQFFRFDGIKPYPGAFELWQNELFTIEMDIQLLGREKRVQQRPA